MLDLDLHRAPTPPRDAATVLVVRDGADGMEIFCVERHVKSAFLGGAVVFPGGKVDDSDRDDAWRALTSAAPRFDDETPELARACAVAVCREALEEAAILLARGGSISHDDVLEMRRALSRREATFRDALLARSVVLDLGVLHPFARWVTPVSESRRFDTRFYLAVAPDGQAGAHDDHETTASFWGSPADILKRFDDGEIQLAPPTHRSLALLASVPAAAAAIELARAACKDPICPRLVEVREAGVPTLALVLPGDPAHEVRIARVPGPSRFVLRDTRWLPEAAPSVVTEP